MCCWKTPHRTCPWHGCNCAGTCKPRFGVEHLPVVSLLLELSGSCLPGICPRLNTCRVCSCNVIPRVDFLSWSWLQERIAYCTWVRVEWTLSDSSSCHDTPWFLLDSLEILSISFSTDFAACQVSLRFMMSERSPINELDNGVPIVGMDVNSYCAASRGNVTVKMVRASWCLVMSLCTRCPLSLRATLQVHCR